MFSSAGFIFDTSIIIRLLAAIILSGLIGIEREIHGRPAGLRTHVLVCLGTTVIIISGYHLAFLFKDITQVGTITMDPGRIAAGIITGIGFIGGGCIIRIGDYVRGLTTAACLWFVASLGIIIGIGLYDFAVMVTLLALVILLLFEKIEEYLPKLHYRELHLGFSLDKVSDVDLTCRNFFQDKRLSVLKVKYSIDRTKGTGVLSYSLRMKNLDTIVDIYKYLSRYEEVNTLEIV